MQEIRLGEDRSTIQKNSRDKLSRLKIFEKFAGFAKKHEIVKITKVYPIKVLSKRNMLRKSKISPCYSESNSLKQYRSMQCVFLVMAKFHGGGGSLYSFSKEWARSNLWKLKRGGGDRMWAIHEGEWKILNCQKISFY